MKNLITMVFAGYVAVAASDAFAADNLAKDGMMKKDSMAKEGMMMKKEKQKK